MWVLRKMNIYLFIYSFLYLFIFMDLNFVMAVYNYVTHLKKKKKKERKSCHARNELAKQFNRFSALAACACRFKIHANYFS